jgi:hypothetical protein
MTKEWLTVFLGVALIPGETLTWEIPRFGLRSNPEQFLFMGGRRSGNCLYSDPNLLTFFLPV